MLIKGKGRSLDGDMETIINPLLGVLLILGAFFFYSTVSSKAAAEEKIRNRWFFPSTFGRRSKAGPILRADPGKLLRSCLGSRRGQVLPLELYVDAPTDENGQIIYDDGQIWTLVLRKHGYFYPLMEKQYIQQGNVSYSAYYSHEDDAFHIMVIKTSGRTLIFTNVSMTSMRTHSRSAVSTRPRTLKRYSAIINEERYRLPAAFSRTAGISRLFFRCPFFDSSHQENSANIRILAATTLAPAEVEKTKGPEIPMTKQTTETKAEQMTTPLKL